MILFRLLHDVENVILLILFVLALLIFVYGVYQIIILYLTFGEVRTEIQEINIDFNNIGENIERLINNIKFMTNDINAKLTSIGDLFS